MNITCLKSQSSFGRAVRAVSQAFHVRIATNAPFTGELIPRVAECVFDLELGFICITICSSERNHWTHVLYGE